MNKKYFETKSGSLEEISTKIATEQPTITKEEPKIKLERKTYLENKPGSLEDAAAKVVSEGKELEEVLDEANIVFKAKAKEGGYFLVLKRDTSGMSGSQDKFLMRHLKGNKVKELGSHPSLDGAKTFGKNKGIIEEVEHDLEEEISESPFAVSYSGTKTSDRKQRGANIITQKTGTIKVDAKDEDSAKKLVSKILDKRMNLRRYDIDRVRAEDFKTFGEGQQPGFAVRYLDPKNGKRFAVAFKTKVDATKKAAQLKSVGVKDISITQHNLNFKEAKKDLTYESKLANMLNQRLK